MVQAEGIQEAPPAAALLQLLMGKLVSQAVCAAAVLGVADQIDETPKSSGDVAANLGVHAASLYRLLRALTSVGVFHEIELDRFVHTQVSRSLRADAPLSAKPIALMVAAEWHCRAWDNYPLSVRNGQSAFSQTFGLPLFEYLDQHPDAGNVFGQAMASMARAADAALLASYDFSASRTIVDIGGGQGTLVREVLRKYPEIRVILFDRPDVIDQARARLPHFGDRFQSIAGDFFQALPEGADTYILKFVIHDWDDEQAILLLRNCRRSLAPNGTLLLVEHVVPGPGEPSVAKLLDLDISVLTGGQKRTEPEFGVLAEAAGLLLRRIVSPPPGFPPDLRVIEMIPGVS